MTCPDLCTAAKCAELEQRIGALEQALELIEAAFEAHTQQDIPTAHLYEPRVNVEAVLRDGTLAIDVSVENASDIATVDLPFCTKAECGEIYQGLQLLEASFEAHIIQDIPEAHNYVSDRGDPQVTVGMFELGNNQFGISVTVDGSQGQDEFTINIPEPEPPPSSDPQVNVDVINNGNNNFTIAVTVDGARGEDLLSIGTIQGERGLRGEQGEPGERGEQGEPGELMNCDNLAQDITIEIENCCSQILGAISNLQGSLIAIENTINNVEDYVTVDISGQVQSNFTCDFETLPDSEELKPGYAVSAFETVNISNQGIQGLHEYLKIIVNNLATIHQDSCKAIDPIDSIKLSDIYRYCDNSGINRSDYADDDEGQRRYDEAIQAYFNDLLANSKYADLVANANGDILIKAPNNWITAIRADFALIQGKINNAAVCDIDLKENPEVVSIVASDNVLGRATGKFLVLHLVTFENYPKRSRNSTYWQVQIPQAKETYDWSTDFLNLVWQRGNLYAELFFIGLRDPVSGYFANKNAADAWFNSVLNLTNAVEKNRKYHERTNPMRNIETISTRPYRAFISEINDVGRTICHVKYVPTPEP